MKRALTKEHGISGTFVFSLLLHITLFGIIYRFSTIIHSHLPEPQTYYVDVVNLPVASPQAGTSSTPEKMSPPKPSPPPGDASAPYSTTKA